jgi:hypothetical protein
MVNEVRIKTGHGRKGVRYVLTQWELNGQMYRRKVFRDGVIFVYKQTRSGRWVRIVQKTVPQRWQPKSLDPELPTTRQWTHEWPDSIKSVPVAELLGKTVL